MSSLSSSEVLVHAAAATTSWCSTRQQWVSIQGFSCTPSHFLLLPHQQLCQLWHIGDMQQFRAEKSGRGRCCPLLLVQVGEAQRVQLQRRSDQWGERARREGGRQLIREGRGEQRRGRGAGGGGGAGRGGEAVETCFALQLLKNIDQTSFKTRTQGPR